jgi:DeoR family glycerol-3-phosphate regulon repressor
MSIALEQDGALTQRQQDIVRIVAEQGYATIEALAQRFGVSTQSIRRDIIYLDKVRQLQRFHGGAGVAETTVRLGYQEKRTRASDAKLRIGRAAAGLVPPGASVFIDVGTTAEAVARALANRQAGLRVFTTSLGVATILAGEADLELYVFGGAVRGADGSLTGAATLAGIAGVRFDLAFLGYSGFDHDGTIMDFDLEKIAVKQAVLRRCDSPVAIGDQSKFARRALATVAALDAFSHLVTDARPPAGLREAFERANLEICLA